MLPVPSKPRGVSEHCSPEVTGSVRAVNVQSRAAAVPADGVRRAVVFGGSLEYPN